MAHIKTSSGEKIHYTNRVLYGQKTIDKPKAAENLLLVKEVMDAAKVKFLLIAGTLLGAVREHDFITHDEDIDLAFLSEDKQNVFDALPALLSKGFEIARYDRRNLMSVIRNGEYIDFYFFRPKEKGLSTCNGWLIPTKFIENTTLLEFKGVEYNIPCDYIEYLKYEYGLNWRTPIQWFNYLPPKSMILKIYIKERSKEYLPSFIMKYLSKRAESKFEAKYRETVKKYIENGGTIE